jgi:serine/threonine protein kinase
MAISLEQFTQQLVDSGLMSANDIDAAIQRQNALVENAEQLAKLLVKQKKLTSYQARQIYSGKAKSLIFGNYDIVDKLGQGGMGVVLRGRHRRMHRDVAIKVLPAAMIQDAAAIARFQREVVAAAQLMHPNIVAAYDADEVQGQHILVMEYVKGRDLSSLVKSNGPLRIDQAIDCVLQTARGLEFAHKRGVIHRDIKPANLLLDNEGTVKILDMGLARFSEAAGDVGVQAELTGTGIIMGTVDYMSPEQALSTKTADARSDIYSLGITFYYLITGQPAYAGETLTARLLAQQTAPIPLLRNRQPAVSDNVQAIFEKMVAKRPEDRYASMTEVLADLGTCRVDSAGKPPHSQIEDSDDAAAGELSGFLKTLHVGNASATSPTRTAVSSGSQTGPFPGEVTVITGAASETMSSLWVKSGQKSSVAREKMPVDWRVIVGGGTGLAAILLLVVFLSRRSPEPVAEVLTAPSSSVQSIVTPPTRDFGQGQLPITDAPPLAIAPFNARQARGHQVPAENSVALQHWIAQTRKLTAEQQIDAVNQKLVELNPGFHGKLTNWGSGLPTIENGQVIELKFIADGVTDISPLQAFSSLKKLNISSNAGAATLKDLAPLKEMRLTDLICIYSLVDDLSPLRGMPLQHLYCGQTPVSDLTPLDGMPLTLVDCGSTAVSDLSPLKSAPLQTLWLMSTNVTDLTPLSGKNLTDFRFTPENITKGLHVIRDMKSLRYIGLDTNRKNTFPAAEFWKKYDAGEFGKLSTQSGRTDGN